jgi:hypothetical protein
LLTCLFPLVAVWQPLDQLRLREPLAKEGSISFLKKRIKKLLLVLFTRRDDHPTIDKNKSFLVLFFKKELLS